MSLKFGDLEVQDNQILTPIITSKSFEFVPPPTNSVHYVYIIINLTTDTLYWVNDEGIEVVSYRPPVETGRYMFIMFLSDNIELPEQVHIQDFMKYHKTSDFGTIVYKVRFNVQPASLDTYEDISFEVLRRLPVKEILDLCQKSDKLNLTCQNKEFWNIIARNRITDDPKVLSSSGLENNPQLIQDTIIANDNFMVEARKVRTPKEHGKFLREYFEDINEAADYYNILYRELLTALDFKFKLALFQSALKDNRFSLQDIFNAFSTRDKVKALRVLTMRDMLEFSQIAYNLISPNLYSDIIDVILSEKSRFTTATDRRTLEFILSKMQLSEEEKQNIIAQHNSNRE
jgi:hypothetical protein